MFDRTHDLLSYVFRLHGRSRCDHLHLPQRILAAVERLDDFRAGILCSQIHAPKLQAPEVDIVCWWWAKVKPNARSNVYVVSLRSRTLQVCFQRMLTSANLCAVRRLARSSFFMFLYILILIGSALAFATQNLTIVAFLSTMLMTIARLGKGWTMLMSIMPMQVAREHEGHIRKILGSSKQAKVDPVDSYASSSSASTTVSSQQYSG